MLYRQRTFTLFFLLSISQTIFANSKLLPGYYIANNGDSISCNIEYEDWYNNPQTIQVEVNNEKKTLGANDIKGFGAFGYSDYRSALVSYHTNPINGTELPDKFSDSTTTKNIFLKVLVKGPYTLYELEVTARKYFFIQKNDSTISELQYRVAVQYGEIKEDKQYANTLAALFQDEGILDRYRGRVYGASYNSDIISLVRTLDYSRTGVKIKRVASARFQADLFAGITKGIFPSLITHGIFPAYSKLSSAASFSGGINLIYVVPQRFNSLKLGLSIAYARYQGTGSKTDSIVDKADLNNWRSTTYTENLSVTNTSIITNLYAAYTLNPLSKLKFYVKGGLSFSFGKKDANVVDNYTESIVGFNSGNTINYGRQGSEQPVSLSNVLINPLVGAGLETGRHKLEFSFYIPVNDSPNTDNFFKVGMAAVYYYFAIFK